VLCVWGEKARVKMIFGWFSCHRSTFQSTFPLPELTALLFLLAHFCSWRNEDPLEMWDFKSGNKISSVEWFKSELSGQSCMLYAAQFSKFGQTPNFTNAPKFIAAGGSGANEARVFDCNNGNSCIGSITGLSRGIFTVDWSSCEDKFACAGGDASIRIVNVLKKKNAEKLAV